jgi:subtilisin family serine protease
MLDFFSKWIRRVNLNCLSVCRLFYLLVSYLACTGVSQAAAIAPVEALNILSSGQSVDLIVEYNSDDIELAAASMRKNTRHQLDDDKVLSYKKSRYKALKKVVDQAAARTDIETLDDYAHLPMTFKRFKSKSSLYAYLAHVKVKAVYPNKTLHRLLAQSLPLINQPEVFSAGEKGSGTTVAVIDDGIDYTNAAFGSCSAPGSPANCRVVSSINFGTGTTDNTHGTNVSAIVLGVAPSSKIAMINVFSGTSAFTSDVIAGINWAITNQSLYNIVAINMSLGDGSLNTTACQSGNAFFTPVTRAKNAGISVVAAAGNEAYTNGISSPACTPGIISVGAVYDANVGGLIWGNNLCTDLNTATDKVACFSDSASMMTMWAPGAMITAAGISDGGTSQSTPHVAGAIAVIRSTYPSETLTQTQTRLTSSGVPITDSRNGIVKPRLNLLEAVRPLNDHFASRFSLSGSSGSGTGVSLLSSKEIGEPDHAGMIGAHSVWWKWKAPGTGQLSLDTHGSNFDTLLAVYSGVVVSALTAINANDNDGFAGNNSGLLLQVQAGKEY